jgi:pimeloyl-ACP methyl ester carboxylesterase
MKPWPALAPYGRRVHLPHLDLTLFLYDTGAPEDAAREGPPPPLLLIHGLGDEADTWRHLIPLLPDRYQIVAPDLPGFGRSDKPKRAYDLAFYQAAMLALLDELEIERAVATGHSLGAAIAQSLALDHPDRVSRLVLIDGCLVTRSQPLNLATLLFLVPGLGEWQYNRLRNDPEAAYRSLAPYYADLDGLPEADRSFLYQRVNERVWSDGQRRAFLSTLRQMARTLPGIQQGLPERLAGCQAPTLVIWGGQDAMNPIDNGQALVELQPGARLETIAGAGHNVHQEEPWTVLAAMSAHLMLSGRPAGR